jgi:hypothetical protein
MLYSRAHSLPYSPFYFRYRAISISSLLFKSSRHVTCLGTKSPSHSAMSSYPSSTCATDGSSKRYFHHLLLKHRLILSIAYLIYHLYHRSSPLTQISSSSSPQKASISKTDASFSNHNGTLHSSLSISTSNNDRELAASRIADYLGDPSASHVQPQHVSPQETVRILAKKISYLSAFDQYNSGSKRNK